MKNKIVYSSISLALVLIPVLFLTYNKGGKSTCVRVSFDDFKRKDELREKIQFCTSVLDLVMQNKSLIDVNAEHRFVCDKDRVSIFDKENNQITNRHISDYGLDDTINAFVRPLRCSSDSVFFSVGRYMNSDHVSYPPIECKVIELSKKDLEFINIYDYEIYNDVVIVPEKRIVALLQPYMFSLLSLDDRSLLKKTTLNHLYGKIDYLEGYGYVLSSKLRDSDVLLFDEGLNQISTFKGHDAFFAANGDIYFITKKSLKRRVNKHCKFEIVTVVDNYSDLYPHRIDLSTDRTLIFLFYGSVVKKTDLMGFFTVIYDTQTNELYGDKL